jgi:large subunit ribosomal protein L13
LEIKDIVMYRQKTYVLKSEETVKNWHLIDASGLVVGRLATEVARILRGKNLATYTPNTDSGDFVVIINCEKVSFTGQKWKNKIYHWHTNHIGGLKQRTAREQLAKHPEKILMEAVKGMLPKTSLGRKQLTKLKIFSGSEHCHQAQMPKLYKIND